jgi:hypothetical protein
LEVVLGGAKHLMGWSRLAEQFGPILAAASSQVKPQREMPVFRGSFFFFLPSSPMTELDDLSTSTRALE